MRGEEGIDRSVAIGVQVQRHAQLVDLLYRLVDDLLRGGQLPLPVLLAAGSAGKVGRGEIGGFALREPSMVILTPPIFRWSWYAPQPLTGLASRILSRSVMNG